MSKKGRNGALHTQLDADNPVYNFLVSYYGLKGSRGVRRLLAYSPGPYVPFNIAAAGSAAVPPPLTKYLQHDKARGYLYYDPALMACGASKQLEWNLNLLKATRANAPILNCHGLHEWAMVYKNTAEEKSYQPQLEFRVAQEEIDRVVETSTLRCSHIDALRMFSEDAQRDIPNEFGSIGVDVSREDQAILEQPGCIHAAIDLLKWCLKVSCMHTRAHVRWGRGAGEK